MKVAHLIISSTLIFGCTKFKNPVDAGLDGPSPDGGDATSVGGSGGSQADGQDAVGGGPQADAAPADVSMPESGTDACPASGCTDTTPPRVLSATPANGQTGVTSDAQLLVTFSEPMNQSSVRLAYSSSTLLPGQLTFTWNAAGTTLTMTPTAPLQYAVGSSPTIAPTSYSYQISNAATDLAGNHLESPLSVTFTTLKRISASLLTPSQMVFYLLDNTPNGPSGVTPNFCTDTGIVGHNVGLAFDSVDRLFVGFQVPAPPAGIYSVESATFAGIQLAADGNPYSMSNLSADEIPYQTAPDASSNTALAIRSLGTFATSATITNPSIDVKATLQQAFTASGHQIMLRLQFGALPSTNSLAHFTCNGFTLSWVYLVS